MKGKIPASDKLKEGEDWVPKYASPDDILALYQPDVTPDPPPLTAAEMAIAVAALEDDLPVLF